MAAPFAEVEQVEPGIEAQLPAMQALVARA
jgi:hypothetical protein